MENSASDVCSKSLAVGQFVYLSIRDGTKHLAVGQFVYLSIRDGTKHLHCPFDLTRALLLEGGHVHLALR